MSLSMEAFWNQGWNEGLWAAAWSRAVSDLTLAQAVWRPASGRHCIWQQVAHMVFWRGVALRRARTGQSPSDAEIQQENFAIPERPDEAGWRNLQARLERSQEEVRAAIAEGVLTDDRTLHVMAHDCYHMGQIHYLRALQGLKPVE